MGESSHIDFPPKRYTTVHVLVSWNRYEQSFYFVVSNRRLICLRRLFVFSLGVDMVVLLGLVKS